MSKNKKNYKTEFNWTDKTDHPIDYKELDKENKAFWIEQKKPKRQKIDDSKNGDYFTFCRNKKCNQPLYKNRSNMDTRYCMECLQKGNMKSKYIKNNKDLLKFAQWCDEKIGMGFHWDNDFDEYIWNCFSNGDYFLFDVM